MNKPAFLKLLGLDKLPRFDADAELHDHETIEILAAQELQQWHDSQRQEVSESYDAKILALIEHCQQQRSFAFYYQAGTNPGQLRKVTPSCIFRTQDSDLTYLIGHCQLRDAQRTFRVDRLSLA